MATRNKVRCPACDQHVKPRPSADRTRWSCTNCGEWHSDDPDDVLELPAPPAAAAPTPTKRRQAASRAKAASQAKPAPRAKAARLPSRPAGHAAPARDFSHVSPHLVGERFEASTRLGLFLRLRDSYQGGLWDPELLYLGARYALSLGRTDDARTFAEQLAALLKAGGPPPPAYFPVGLLLLQLTRGAGEHERIAAELEELAAGSSLFTAALQLAGVVEPEGQPADAPHRLLHGLSQGAQPLEPELRALITAADDGATAAASALTKLYRRGRRAGEAYAADELKEARAALEGMLLVDGAQPDVLRNLITLAGEQGDVEAYERYWRRYVKVLLWRVMCGGDAPAAYDDLIRFYSRVATITDREFNETPGKLGEKLRTPGLLPRWLEAHAGLAWLDAATRPHRQHQTDAPPDQYERGWLGRLSLMRFWYAVFYPEFYRFVEPGAGAAEPAPDLRPARPRLAFDPALVLLSRFAEWSNYGFWLEVERESQEMVDDRHAEAVAALAGCVARIPCQSYVPVIEKKLETGGESKMLFRRVWQDVCSMALRARRDRLWKEEDWDGVVAVYGIGGLDPEVLEKFTPMSRVLVAHALCRAGREGDGLEVACQLLPELLPEEFGEESPVVGWWLNVFEANLAKAAEEDSTQAFERIRERLRQVPELEAAPDFIAERMKLVGDIESRVRWAAIKDELTEHMQQGRYSAALGLIGTLPESGDEAIELKQSLLERVELERAYEQLGELVREGKFKEGRALVRNLKIKSEEGRKQRDDIISQLERAEQNYEIERVNKLIDAALERAKVALDRSDYAAARRVISDLPAKPEEVAKLKRDLLAQIDEREQGDRLNKLVEEVVAQAKAAVERGSYANARRAINRLPDKPADIANLKRDYLKQIDEAERSEIVNKIVDTAVQAAKAAVGRGDYEAARRAIRELPNSPTELAELKRNYTKQIDEAEAGERAVKRENDQITSYLRSRQVDFFKIKMIARENGIDVNNPYDYNSLLKAIQKQIRGY